MSLPCIRIEICGGIATGKTTLANRFVERYRGSLILEDFRANPFWKRFYQEPTIFFREKNISFLAQHAGEIRAVTEGVLVCDYAVVQDLAYAKLAGEPEHVAAMEHVYSHLYLSQPAPSLVVHLVCDAVVQLKRIRQRGRKEEGPITVEYLQSLNEALQETLAVRPPGAALLTVRSDEINFVGETPAAQALLERLSKMASPKQP